MMAPYCPPLCNRETTIAMECSQCSCWARLGWCHRMWLGWYRYYPTISILPWPHPAGYTAVRWNFHLPPHWAINIIITHHYCSNKGEVENKIIMELIVCTVYSDYVIKININDDSPVLLVASLYLHLFSASSANARYEELRKVLPVTYITIVCKSFWISDSTYYI